MDIYDSPDTVFFLPVGGGTSDAFEKVSGEFEVGREVACILLKVGGQGFSGSCRVESPYILRQGERLVDIPFRKSSEVGEGSTDYWVGCNLSSHSWPEWRLSFNGKVCFEGNVFDRASNVADFYIPLPEWVGGEGVFTLTLVSEPPQTTFPYVLKSFELLEEPARDFEAVSVPKYVTVGETAGILVETNRRNVRIGVTCAADSIVSPASRTLVFDEPGLHVVRIKGIAPGTDVPVSLTDGFRTVNVSITQRQLQIGRELSTPFGDRILLGLLHGGLDGVDGGSVRLGDDGGDTVLGISAIDGIRLPAVQVGKTARYDYFGRVHILRHRLVLLLKIRFCG